MAPVVACPLVCGCVRLTLSLPPHPPFPPLLQGTGIPPPPANNGILPPGAFIPVVVGVPVGFVLLVGAAVAAMCIRKRRAAPDWGAKGGAPAPSVSSGSAGSTGVAVSVVPNPLARAEGDDGDAASRLSARLGQLGAADPSGASMRKVALGPMAIGRMEAAPTGVGVDGTPAHAGPPPVGGGGAASGSGGPAAAAAAPTAAAAPSDGSGRAGWDSRSINIARAIAIKGAGAKVADTSNRG